MSIAEICKEIPSVDFSTVFRNLEQLCLQGEVRKIFLDKENILYEIMNVDNPHDHFFCVSCRKISSLPPLQKNLEEMPHSQILDVLVRGICKQCKK